jgi:PHS family inorganic phosphate transporter-like MFS transporter
MNLDEHLIMHHQERIQQPNHSNHQQRLAMLSNFSTSYNVVNIALVLPILRILFPTEHIQQDESFLASSLLVGMMLGQVLGGIMGDAIGRLRALRLVMILQMVASFASATLTSSWSSLAVWRCLLGVGAGGVYPLAAVLSAEQASSSSSNSKDDDLHRVVLTFATQGVGFWMAPAMGYLLLLTCSNLQVVWRLLLGLGALPGIVLFYLQWKVHKDTASWEASYPPENEETPHLWQGGTPQTAATTTEPSSSTPNTTTENDSDGEETTVLDSTAEPDGLFDDRVHEQQTWWESVRNEPQLVQKLLGTAATWFLFDVLFYGNALFQPIVLEAAFGNSETNTLASLQLMARNSLILASIALPGYGVAAFLMGRSDIAFLPSQTPRYVMLQGFACMAVLYGVIGVFWNALKRIHPSVLLLLYGLTFFFSNYGPNTSTFVLPSMVYSESCRSSLNGVSAAAGKLGAFTGASLFAPAAYQWGNAAVMLICAVVAVLSFFLTQACVPSDYHAIATVQEDDTDDELRILDVPLAINQEGEERTTPADGGVEVQEL